MKLLNWDAFQIEMIVRGLKTIASVNGTKPISQLDVGLINGITNHLLRSNISIDNVKEISPKEFARSFEDPSQAENAMEFLVIMPYTDTEAKKDKVEIVNQFSDALNIHSESLRMLHLAKDRHVMEMEFCLFRKMLPSIAHGETLLDRLSTLKKQITLKKYDMKMALRYELLGLLPEDTLGRSIWQFYRTRGFAFAGEGHINVDEGFIFIHDISHILAGFDTTLEGEIAVSAFQGGNKNDHGWLLAVVGILDFHLGLAAYTGPNTITKGHLVPEEFAAALEMGANTNRDLSLGWDPWEHMSTPLNELRKEYNIIGAKDIHKRSPEGWWKVPPESWWNF